MIGDFLITKQTGAEGRSGRVGGTRWEIITVRGQSYVSRLPKYWPPPPASVSSPPHKGGGGGYTLAGQRGGWGTSYSNNLSTGALDPKSDLSLVNKLGKMRITYRGTQCCGWLKIPHHNTSKQKKGWYFCWQCWGSRTFWYGSGSADPWIWRTDPDPAPDTAIFVSDLQNGK
jgi:hypothetical protein